MYTLYKENNKYQIENLSPYELMNLNIPIISQGTSQFELVLNSEKLLPKKDIEAIKKVAIETLREEIQLKRWQIKDIESR